MLGEACGCSFCHYCKTQALRNSGSCESLHPLFLNVPWAFGARVHLRCIHWDWAPCCTFWLVVVVSSSHWLLQRDVFLMRGVHKCTHNIYVPQHMHKHINTCTYITSIYTYHTHTHTQESQIVKTVLSGSGLGPVWFSFLHAAVTRRWWAVVPPSSCSAWLMSSTSQMLRLWVKSLALL